MAKESFLFHDRISGMPGLKKIADLARINITAHLLVSLVFLPGPNSAQIPKPPPR